MSAAPATTKAEPKRELRPGDAMPPAEPKAEPRRRESRSTTGRLDVRAGDELVKQFEAVALLQGQSATEMVVEFMKATVERHMKAVGKPTVTMG